MPKPTDRSPASVELAVSNPAERDLSGSIGRIPYLPWVASALLGSGAAVLLGWVTVGVAVAAGWLTMTRLPPTTVLDTIAQLWLGLHGVPFTAAGLTVGLTPLGLTGLVAVAMAAVARYAAGQREDDGQAVSYTHLDVYKRQGLIWAPTQLPAPGVTRNRSPVAREPGKSPGGGTEERVTVGLVGQVPCVEPQSRVRAGATARARASMSNGVCAVASTSSRVVPVRVIMMRWTAPEASWTTASAATDWSASPVTTKPLAR